MQIEIAIDDDVVAAVRSLAAEDQRSLGEVISALARQALGQVEPRAYRNGVPLLKVRDSSARVTPEIVNELRDEAQ